MDSVLIGRERELEELQQALACARRGEGRILLLMGEAGVGKTRLARESLADSNFLVLGGTGEQGSAPYAPVAGVLRSYLRTVPDGLTECGPLSPHLALLLPELGPRPVGADRSTIFEAVREAFDSIAARGPTAVFLDDLQWADNATLELLPALAVSLAQIPLLIVGAYRSDEVIRGHPLRRMRVELRRAGQLHELTIEPLNWDQTTALAQRILGGPIAPHLAAILYDRTQGVAFFVEELAAALADGRLRSGTIQASPAAGEDMPIPAAVRDAVLQRVESLSRSARRVLEAAAAAGMRFDLDLVADLLDGDEGLDEAIESGFLIEFDGMASFRHVLVREAIYGDIPWTGRRALHRRIAGWLDAHGASPSKVAEHWLAASEDEPARLALVESASADAGIHAYRDALDAGRRALELWPDGRAEPDRLDLLTRVGEWAELCGEVSTAVRAWREAEHAYRVANDHAATARVERRLAAVYELETKWESAIDTRQSAADAFAAAGMAADAALERLVAAAHLRSAASFGAALALLETAETEASGQPDLRARILGLRGNLMARMGRVEEGLSTVQSGLALALEHDLTVAATEIYQRLADSLEHAGEYTAARAAYGTAAEYCQTHGAGATAQLCFACLTMVLRLTGEWDQAATLSRLVLASPESTAHARTVASGVLGALHVLRAEPRRARPLLLQASTLARKIELTAMELDSTWGLAMLDDLARAPESALGRCTALLHRWERTEERHYVVPALYWTATFCAERNAVNELRACSAGLARIAAATGQPEALAGLAHALGETALAEGDAVSAASQFDRAIELLHDRPLPFERAQSMRRAGSALIRAGQRGAGVDRLVSAYRTAQRLGARVLAGRISDELLAMGEPVERRLGRRAADRLEHAGLTRREIEVLQRIANGHTNREIGRQLFLSTRTIDMHVSNILIKLDCRSRADASRRASELGLLAHPNNST